MSLHDDTHDQLTALVGRCRESITKIAQAAYVIEAEAEVYEAVRAQLKDEFGVEMNANDGWTPFAAAALREWHRRHEQNVEAVMPQSLRALS